MADPEDFGPERIDSFLERNKDLLTKRAEQAAAEEEARRQAEAARWVAEQLTKIPPRYIGAELDYLPVRQWMERFLEEPYGPKTKGLVIAGPTGTGKTRQMWGLYRALVARQFEGIEVRKLVGWIDSFRPGRKGTPEEFDIATDASLLMLDDLGVEKMSDWVEEKLYMLVDTRYENLVPTIFTTNEKREDLAKRIGRRVADRILESSQFIVMDGKNWRES